MFWWLHMMGLPAFPTPSPCVHPCILSQQLHGLLIADVHIQLKLNQWQVLKRHERADEGGTAVDAEVTLKRQEVGWGEGARCEESSTAEDEGRAAFKPATAVPSPHALPMPCLPFPKPSG